MPKSEWQCVRNLLSEVGVVGTSEAGVQRGRGAGAGGIDELVFPLSSETDVKILATAARSDFSDETDGPRPPGSSDWVLLVGSKPGELGGAFVVVSPSYCGILGPHE